MKSDKIVSNLKIGDTVDYHAIFNGPVTSSGHKILSIDREPNNYGCDIAFISQKRGCVALRNLTSLQAKKVEQT